MAGFSTDPTLNATGPGTVPAGTQRGHFTRMFVALDAEGNVIPNTYLVIQDYTGINYDYNDNMFVVVRHHAGGHRQGADHNRAR